MPNCTRKNIVDIEEAGLICILGKLGDPTHANSIVSIKSWWAR